MGKIRFKVINLTIANDNEIGVEILLAELSKVNEGNKFSFLLPRIKFSANGQLYVFLSSSSKAKLMMDSPEEILELSMNEFTKENYSLNGLIYDAYLHKDYIHKRSFISINSSTTNHKLKIEDYLEECLFIYPMDMHFLAIYRLIIGKEFENKNNNTEVNAKKVLQKFKKVSAHLVNLLCEVNITDEELVEDENWFNLKHQYYDMVEFFIIYRKFISAYIGNYSDVEETFVSIGKNGESISDLFYNRLIIKGYNTAIKRLESNQNLTDFLDHELVEANGAKVLKVFPTAHGFIKKWELVELAKSGQFDQILDNYLDSVGFTRINDDELINSLDTEYIFKNNMDGDLYYYKKRPKNVFYTTHGEQDRVNPIKSLLVQGQMNLTRID